MRRVHMPVMAVAMTTAAVSVVVGSGAGVQRSFAAPLTGMKFISPVRAFDGAVAPGTSTMNVPIPFTAVKALVDFILVSPATGDSGAVMAHACAAPADPATDVVLPVQAAAGVVTNTVFVPTLNGQFCITSTAAMPRFIVDVHGYVDASGGAAYVDVPFEFVTTIVGPANDVPIDLSAFSLPADAAGVAVWLDVTATTAGFATLHPCAEPRPLASDVNWAAGDVTTFVIPGAATFTSGLCIFVFGSAFIDISIDGYYSPTATPTATSPPEIRYTMGPAPGFVGMSPQRLFDTRTANAPVVGGQAYRLDLTPFVPADATAVVMNVTVTEASANGYISVYPCDGDRPEVSNLNYGPGDTVPNLVTVDAGGTLEVCFFALTTTHLLADLAGYYVFGGGDGYAAVPPVRLFDTRSTAKRPGQSVFDFDLSSFVPADASSVVFNLTATEAAGPGYITAYPCGQATPLASNLNVSAGQTVPNLVTVALPNNKHVCIFTLASTHLVADLAGYYAPSAPSGFIAIPPIRWIDTRLDSPDPLPAGDIEPVEFLPAFTGATAMIFNATVTEPTLAGFLTAFPCSGGVPVASNVNFVAGQSVPNLVIAPLGADDVCLFNSAPLQWIVDVSGFFTDVPLFVPYFPPGTDDT